jgi:hypothetical protein
MDSDSPEPAVSVEVEGKAKRQKPTKILPTERMAFQKQLDLLRAYAIAYESKGKPVNNADVAAILKMAATTMPHANGFFADLGLIQRSEGGYIPSQDVMSFHRAFAWNSEDAAKKLRPVFAPTWFAQALVPRLAFRGTLEEREAIAILAEAAGATPEYKGALALLLDYLAVTGIIERDGDLVRRPSDAGQPPALQSAEQMLGPTPVVFPPLGQPPKPQAMTLPAMSNEQILLAILDPDAMSETEQDAVWTLLKFLKKKGRGKEEL